MTVDGTAERGRAAELVRPGVAVLMGRRIRVRSGPAGPRVGEAGPARTASGSGHTFEAASDAVDLLWVVTVPRTGG
ncbi:hypothetical protein [Nocardiopsis dassonvillei]|uniref:hypothetical protein n=1 Tax=Nocardiopsis dassonvillei TaxID=2014 RepID=UPI00366BD845